MGRPYDDDMTAWINDDHAGGGKTAVPPAIDIVDFPGQEKSDARRIEFPIVPV